MTLSQLRAITAQNAAAADAVIEVEQEDGTVRLARVVAVHHHQGTKQGDKPRTVFTVRESAVQG